jgi:hypothetical protein
MRALPAALLLTLSFALPAAAACPGTVVFTDLFKTPNPALDLTANAQSAVAIAAGKAEITFLQTGVSRNEEYSNTQYGDANICAAFTVPKTDKAVNPALGIIFWGASYTSFYSFQIQPVAGTMSLAQMTATGWTFPIAWTANAAVVKTLGAVNTLEVQTKGASITLLINGLTVATSSGTPPAGGGVVGFTVSGSTTNLDTLDITSFTVAIP